MRYVFASLFAALVLSAVPAAGQTKTATQFYMEYTAVFAKAKTIDEILPFMAKERVEQVKKTPAGERAKMFEFIKMMNTYRNVKVAKETKTPTGYTLDVTGTSSDTSSATGTISIVNENGAMKIDKESWTSKS